VTLAPELDQTALVGLPAAKQLFGADGAPTTIYLRSDPDQVPDLQGVLAATPPRGRVGPHGAPTTISLRADPDQVPDVQGVLAATANPEHPNEVQVSRPSDALAAQAAAKSALN